MTTLTVAIIGGVIIAAAGLFVGFRRVLASLIVAAIAAIIIVAGVHLLTAIGDTTIIGDLVGGIAGGISDLFAWIQKATA